MAEYLKTLETRARRNSSPSSQGKTKAPSRFAPVCTEEVLSINAETIPKLKYFDKLLAYLQPYHPLPAKASFRFTLGGGGTATRRLIKIQFLVYENWEHNIYNQKLINSQRLWLQFFQSCLPFTASVIGCKFLQYFQNTARTTKSIFGQKLHLNAALTKVIDETFNYKNK